MISPSIFISLPVQAAANEIFTTSQVEILPCQPALPFSFIFLHFSHVLTLITLLTACGVRYFKFENILHIGSESFRKLIKVFNWEQLILWYAHSTGYNHFQKMLKFTGRNKLAENTEIRRLTKFAIVVILELW